MRIFYLIFSFVLFFSFSLSAESGSGKEIFDRYCTVCHSPAMAPMFGAPAAQDLSAWNERKKLAYDRAVEKGSVLSDKSKEWNSINELLETAKVGTDKGMPPKGTCSDCTDDNLRSIIEFMSSAE
jgi:cytochrome c5